MNLLTFQILGVLLGGRIGYAILYQGEKLFAMGLVIIGVYKEMHPVMEQQLCYGSFSNKGLKKKIPEEHQCDRNLSLKQT